MTVGIIMLCHRGFDRAGQVARFWAEAGCPVVIHIDRRVPDDEAGALKRLLADLDQVSYVDRLACDWGTWQLVAATQAASARMLREHPDVSHVFLTSGSCLPLRPVTELNAFLTARPNTDFIESVTTSDVDWTIGGMNSERFTLRFPFSWKRQRALFDRFTALQRRFDLRRQVPEGLVPHMGSQWWCLTRQTLSAILGDPQRDVHERFFRYVWIPDESYFQTLARIYSTSIESRSLTLSQFDIKGMPYTFYDDHLPLLQQSDCFVARKIWTKAERLYQEFLSPAAATPATAKTNPASIDRYFATSVERRSRGRAGLYMQSRFPQKDRENGKTAAPYSVFQGYSELFDSFESWLSQSKGLRVHGHLFGPERAEFAGRETIFAGCLSDSAVLRDYRPRDFLTNLIWNAPRERQCFMLSPNDNQAVNWFIATDPNAHISVISGAWAVPLFRLNQTFATIRREAARLQQIEIEQLKILRSMYVKARVRIVSLADFVADPMGPLQGILDEVSPRGSRRLADLPDMVDLTGFGQFLRQLKNQGMQPLVMGNFSPDNGVAQGRMRKSPPRLVSGAKPE